MSDLLSYLPVCGEDFVNREEVVEHMVAALSRDTVPDLFKIIAPRRMGKTSLLREVHRRLMARPKSNKAIPVWIDVADLLRENVEKFPLKYFQSFVCHYFNYELEPSAPYLWYELRPRRIEDIAQRENFPGVLEYLRLVEQYISEDQLAAAADAAVIAPMRVGEIENKNFVIFLDEVQDIIKVNQWGGNILSTIRSSFEGEKNCILYVFTGSAVRLMSYKIFHGDSPLWGRVHREHLDPLTPDYAIKLAERAADQVELTWEEEKVKNLVPFYCGGYPFYIIAVIKHAARLAPHSTITETVIKEAFIQALFEGDIHDEFIHQTGIHLDQVNERQVSPQILTLAAQRDPVRVKELEAISGYDPQVLQSMWMADMVEFNASEGTVWVEDPVYKRWVRDVYGPLFVRSQRESEVYANLQSTIQRMANDLGRLFEKRIETALWTFRRQKVDGRYFGYPQREVELPGRMKRVDVRREFTPAEFERSYQIDLIGEYRSEAGEPVAWFVESKYWEDKDVSTDVLAELKEKARLYVETYPYLEIGELWICTRRSLSGEVQAFARQNDILFSSEDDVEALLKELRGT